MARYRYEGSILKVGIASAASSAAKRVARPLGALRRLLGLLNAVAADGDTARCGTTRDLCTTSGAAVTAIRAGDADGNDATVLEIPGWETFMRTPPLPEHLLDEQCARRSGRGGDAPLLRHRSN